jgi:hypothetical protein
MRNNPASKELSWRTSCMSSGMYSSPANRTRVERKNRAEEIENTELRNRRSGVIGSAARCSMARKPAPGEDGRGDQAQDRR